MLCPHRVGNVFPTLAPRQPFLATSHEFAQICKTLHFGTLLAKSQAKKVKLRPHSALLPRSISMYLLFAPTVIAFVGIFAITLRNQFTEKTNL